MAIVHFVKSKRIQTVGGLNGVLKYCCKESKVEHEGRPLVSSINCLPQTALREFLNTKELYRSTGGRQYYHMVQSFHPDDPVTPEMAHEIALKLAEQIPGFEIVVATHTDREHIHSHFVINSVSCDTGRKYHSNKESLEQLWKASDQLCLQYGLSVVSPKKKQGHAMSDREYRAYNKGNSWKMNLEINIDECMTQARDREHFIRLMEYRGYEVRWEDTRKHITYTTPNGYKCRDVKLNGIKYHKEEMEHEFRIREEICRRNAGGPAGEDIAGGSGDPCRSRDGEELGCPHRVPEGAGQGPGRDFGEVRHLDYGESPDRVYGSAVGDPAGRWAGQQGNHGAVPADADLGSEGYGFADERPDDGIGETGWENEREVWERNLTGTGTDEAYFQEAVLDFHDPQPDPHNLGTGAAYLVAGLTNIVDHRPVEDCTTKHFRSERKKYQGQTMGGM